MVNRGNGRRIRIPVRKVSYQLPAVDAEPRPLLDAPDGHQSEVVEGRAEVEDTAAVDAELVEWLERTDQGQATVNEIRRQAERRAALELEEERRRLLTRMLTVADNLERAIAHADKDDPMHSGVQLTLDDLLKQLAREGVEPMQALGQRFDPTLHDAVATDGSDGDEVVEVLETGYLLEGELLRPARVVVGSQKS